MIQLNYRDAKPIYEQIKDGMRHLVISNALTADEKLHLCVNWQQHWQLIRIPSSGRTVIWRKKDMSIPFPGKEHSWLPRSM